MTFQCLKVDLQIYSGDKLCGVKTELAVTYFEDLERGQDPVPPLEKTLRYENNILVTQKL